MKYIKERFNGIRIITEEITREDAVKLIGEQEISIQEKNIQSPYYTVTSAMQRIDYGIYVGVARDNYMQ